MKIWQIVKTILYTAIAVLIFVFHSFFVNHVSMLVGTIMILFGVEKLLLHYFEKGNPFHSLGTIPHVVSIIAGIIMLTVLRRTNGNEEMIIKACVLWATWSIMQEVIEIYECIELIREHHLGYLSLLESLAVIVLSIMLINDPIEHWPLHVHILALELLLNFSFTYLYEHLKKQKGKKESESKKND